jgi:hypothetical protein
MNVIFLDIDGVMVTTRTFLARLEDRHGFDPIGAKIIARICEEFDVKIVISSTWRFFSDLNCAKTEEERCHYNSDLRRNLEQYDLMNYIHPDWRTKDIYRHCDGKVRGDEIAEWLSRHPEVKKYAIIDDDSDMLENQMDVFVHTRFDEGIQVSHWRKLEEIFKP